MTHELSIPENTQLMPSERLPPSGARHVKFETIGGYLVRDAVRYPDLNRYT